MKNLLQHKKILFLSFLGGFLLAYSIFKLISYLNTKTIYIAVVGPMTGKAKANGEAYKNGINILLEPYFKNGFHGKKIAVDFYDDQNEPDKAEEKAKEIIASNKYLAVIGHNASSCSKRAAPLYKENKIVAITPASTNTQVTQLGADWYFRTIFNDDLQGKFLANYIKKIIKADKIKVIYEDDDYGKNLANVFLETARELELEVIFSREVPLKEATNQKNFEKVDQELKKAIRDLQNHNDKHFLFVAMGGANGARFVKFYKKKGLISPLIAPDSFASQGFLNALAENDKREQDEPGYYSNGIYVTTPLIFDNANQRAQSFREEYRTKFQLDPDWRAVYAYDSMLVLLEAIRRMELTGEKEKLLEEREKIKSFLKSLDSPQEAIEGATGLNFFLNGDAQKPISIGIYKNRNIISALTQLQLVKEISEIQNPEKAIAEDRIIQFGNSYMYKTNVVYTGVEINEVSALEVSRGTYTLDFYLWFRYIGNINPWEVEFGNAIEPIEIKEDKLALKEDGDTGHYRLYHLKGNFRSNSLPVKFVLGQQPIGISFHHRSLSRKNLIYVIDVLGMGRSLEGTSKNRSELQRRNQILSPSTGYLIESEWSFQDTLHKTSLGNPKYLGMREPNIEYSRFNVGFQIRRDEFSLRRFLPSSLSLPITILAFTGMMVLAVLSSFKSYKQFANLFWFAQTVLAYILLSSTEVELVDRLIEKEMIPMIRLVISTYDLLWWIVPAISVTQAIERFIWIPIETRTDHKIPTVVRRFLNFLIYLLTLFGIVAFVYDQKITSLLATSGVVAMIIGLAIQVNISNIFSGIAINVERPFRVGDWVKIGTLDEGQVVDVTWRTTRLRLRNQVIISIPNSKASESPIINYSIPDGIVEMWFTIHIDPKIPPKRVVKVLLDALLSAEGVLRNPAPYARFNEFTDWSADYLFGYCFKDYGKKNAIRRAVWSSIWTHLHRAGISPAFQKQEILLNREHFKELPDVRSPLSLLEEIEIFEPFTIEEKIYLSQKLKPHSLNKGDVIVRAGDSTNFSMYIIVEGLVSVQAPLENGEKIEVARLGAGNFFGEMSLLTGAIRTADVVADSQTYIYEITKEDIQPLLDAHPEIALSVKTVVTERKENLQTKKQEALYVPPPPKESIFKRLKKKIFISLGLQKELDEEETKQEVKKK